MKLMIVDDHPVMRDKVCGLLSRPGVEVRECGTGEEAMRCVRDFQPDWIVMDVHLPGVNGFQATEEIRKELPSVRVIVISAEERSYLREMAMGAGAEQFLCKHDLADLPEMIFGESSERTVA